MKEAFTFFWSGPFSQWYKSDFTVGEITFNTAEQYMMYKKAELFDDRLAMAAILKTKNPKDQKALGRLVKNFDVNVWNENCRTVVFHGNLHKFMQNARLAKMLVDTEGTTLVEASPYDTIWGIGLLESDPLAQNRETWRGTNWLGEALMQVRSEILFSYKE